MHIPAVATSVVALALAPAVLTGQVRSAPVTGTWQADTPDGPQQVVIRPDSTASFGEETIRWRLVGDSIFLAFGDEWVGYVVALKGNELTVAGGDLEEPLTLRRIGPPTARPDSIPLPPAPPTDRSRPGIPEPLEQDD